MFSKSCKYGLKAVTYIAAQSMDGKRVKADEISKMTGTPKAFVAKLLSTLKNEDIIHSQTGPTGGFFIEYDQIPKIKLDKIVYAIDGDRVYNGCGLGLEKCDENNPCAIHEHYVKIRRDLKKMLKDTSVYDLAVKYRAGESLLVRED